MKFEREHGKERAESIAVEYNRWKRIGVADNVLGVKQERLAGKAAVIIPYFLPAQCSSMKRSKLRTRRFTDLQELESNTEI